MKKFLLFFGEQYYPSQGMEDLLSEHDTMEEALSAFESHVKSEIEEYRKGIEDFMGQKWAIIYDTELRKEVWSYH